MWTGVRAKRHRVSVQNRNYLQRRRTPSERQLLIVRVCGAWCAGCVVSVPGVCHVGPRRVGVEQTKKKTDV